MAIQHQRPRTTCDRPPPSVTWVLGYSTPRAHLSGGCDGWIVCINVHLSTLLRKSLRRELSICTGGKNNPSTVNPRDALKQWLGHAEGELCSAQRAWAAPDTRLCSLLSFFVRSHRKRYLSYLGCVAGWSNTFPSPIFKDYIPLKKVFKNRIFILYISFWIVCQCL